MRTTLAPSGHPLLVGVSAWSFMWFSIMVSRGGTSWHYFVQGAQALADIDDPVRGGLHLYAAHPILQIGPVAIFAALLAMPFGGSVGALAIWQVLGGCAGLLVLWQIRQIAVVTRPDLDRGQITARTAVAAVFVMPVWLFLAVGVAHVDDVLALLSTVCAVRALVSGRPLLAAGLIGLAIDAKPWAVPFAVLLLLAGDRRSVIKALSVLAVVVAAVWTPFFLADAGTVHAMQFTIRNTSLSSLRVLGVNDPSTPPWARPAQAVLGITVGLLALRRGRWAAVLLLAVCARIVLDPGTNRYYIAGVVIGAALWDVVGAKRSSWWTAAAAVLLFGIRWVPMPDRWHGWLTLVYALATCALLRRPRETDAPDPSDHPEGRASVAVAAEGLPAVRTSGCAR